MSRQAKGARLYLQAEQRRNGVLVERAVWCIRDGSIKRRLGLGVGERAAAERKLADYIASKYEPERDGERNPSQIPIADVLNIYISDVVANVARPKEAAARIVRLLNWWGGKMLSDVNGRNCRAYSKDRGTSGGRRELEDLRAAIIHHRREGLCSQIVEVVLPEKGKPRERWLTRSEAARLIWAAWRYREIQKGKPTDRRSRRHVARFVLVALYTGTRASAVCGAALEPTPGHGWIDLERGVFYRRAEGARITKKRQPPVVLPDRLLAHLRRWKRTGVSKRFVVEWNGEPIGIIRRAFGRAVTAAKLPDKVTPHTLRHTAATWLMQNGADLWAAAGYLGMTVEMLERTYGHHHPDHQQSAREAIVRSPGQKPDRMTVNKTRQDTREGAEIVEFSRKFG